MLLMFFRLSEVHTDGFDCIILITECNDIYSDIGIYYGDGFLLEDFCLHLNSFTQIDSILI